MAEAWDEETQSEKDMLDSLEVYMHSTITAGDRRRARADFLRTLATYVDRVVEEKLAVRSETPEVQENVSDQRQEASQR